MMFPFIWRVSLTPLILYTSKAALDWTAGLRRLPRSQPAVPDTSRLPLPHTGRGYALYALNITIPHSNSTHPAHVNATRLAMHSTILEAYFRQ